MIFQFHKKLSSRSHFLMGTMHVQDERAFVFADLAIEKMKTCNCYAGEMDLGQAEAQKIQGAFLLTNPQGLPALVSEKKWNKYHHIIQKCFGFDLSSCQNFAPIFLISLIAQKVYTANRPYSLDGYLYEKAIELGLMTTGLETPQEQLDIAQKLDLPSQLKMLDQLCRRPDKFRRELHELIHAYAAFNYSLLHKKGKRSLGVNRKVLLENRNYKMTEKIIQLTAKDNCFISVGAGHLGGNDGIISGLKKNGYNIRLLPEITNR